MKDDSIILVIDDEPQIRRLLEITLSANGYKVISASSGQEGQTLVASHQPDLVLLDLGLPDVDGTDLLKSLREWYKKPIIILSVRDAEEDIVQGLDKGANDYLIKPFRTNELLARIRAAIRQNQDIPESSVGFYGSISIDFSGHIVRKDNDIIKLTSTEFSLLALLARNEGRVLTHQYILKKIWGSTFTDQTQYLRVFIAQLRKKLENDPSKPELIVTESGIGYRFGS